MHDKSRRQLQRPIIDTLSLFTILVSFILLGVCSSIAFAATTIAVNTSCKPACYGAPSSTGFNEGAAFEFQIWQPTMSADKTTQRRDAVVKAMMAAWDAYVEHAWGEDELLPVSQRGIQSFGGVGVTIIDSMDTLYLMGLESRYLAARDYVLENKSWWQALNGPHQLSSFAFKSQYVNVFETIIRVLGGLVSMAHLSGDCGFQQRAEWLADRLGVAFDSPSGLPWPLCSLHADGPCEVDFNASTQQGAAGEALSWTEKSSRCITMKHTASGVALAEVGSLQLEFRALSQYALDIARTRELRYRAEDVLLSVEHAGRIHAAEVGIEPSTKTNQHINARGEFVPGLLPQRLSLESGRFSSSIRTFGAPADSYYEYIAKLWQQGGYREERYRRLFRAWMRDLEAIVSDMPDVPGGKFVPKVAGASDPPQLSFRMDHFSCFLPGAIYVGRHAAMNDSELRRWQELAEGIGSACKGFSDRSRLKLSGEELRLHNGKPKVIGGHQLRPEAVEGWFYLYRWTRNEKYREWAWEVFEGTVRHCALREGGRRDGRVVGFSTLRNVHGRGEGDVINLGDLLPSYFMAETLKYLFLIFDDASRLPLDRFVFNTEAHPFLLDPTCLNPLPEICPLRPIALLN